MNILPSLEPIVSELTRRFGVRVTSVQATRPNEVYVNVEMELLPAVAAQLYKKSNGRLVNLFADDARADAAVFHLYYVFAFDLAHGFVILRAPVSPDQPQFTSLTNAIHAVN